MIDEAKKELARKVFKGVPFVQLIGLELIDINPGEAVLRLKMRDELRQPHGVMHGGAIASLIDTATAFAQITVLEEGENAVTVDLNMHFLRVSVFLSFVN